MVDILKSKNAFIENIWPIVEYCLVIPLTNAVMEIKFIVINVLWTDKKNHFLGLTIDETINFKKRSPKIIFMFF